MTATGRPTPLQREVEPPPTCSRCGQTISQLSAMYRCAQCDALFDRACIHKHFGWGVNTPPHGVAQDSPDPLVGRWRRDGWHSIECWRVWAEYPETASCRCASAALEGVSRDR